VIHLWNPSGFPPLHPDESVYMIKPMRVLEGYGPQTDKPLGIQLYDHPHFGQLFLAATLAPIGYPHILNLEPSEQSISSIYAVPRLIMGLLAVLDTFIIYKIAQRRYDRTIALVASSLFAVLPITLVLRNIFLDNIMLPFILSSILFALYVRSNKVNYYLILLSGVLLGLAIYTKIPAFTMIPLVGYLIFINSKQLKSLKRVKSLALWIIPVVLIPCLWPVYALSVGQFDLWVDGITAQASRQSEGGNNLLFDSLFLDAFKSIFEIDPVFLTIGISGLLYAAVRKEYWLIIWVVPLLIFSYFIGWVIHFHLVPIFPAFCIAAALLIMRAFRLQLWRRLISPTLILAIICFGFVISMLLVTLNVNSYQFKAQAVVVERLNDNDTVFIGRQVYSWIPRYVFQMSFDVFPRESLPIGWNESKIVFVDNGNSSDKKLRRATEVISTYNRPQLPEYYPYTSVTFPRSIGRNVDVRVTTQPTVMGMSPAGGTSNIQVNSVIKVMFSEPMLSSSISTSTFILRIAGTPTKLGGAVSLSSDGKTATFEPSANLATSTRYVATIFTGAMDLAGNALSQSKKWSFTTVAASTGY
jgi:hypothetical protein